MPSFVYEFCLSTTCQGAHRRPMQLRPFSYAVLFLLASNSSSFAAPTATETKQAEVAWDALIKSLDSKQKFDANVYTGRTISFTGELTDKMGGNSITHVLSKSTVRPVVICSKILRADSASGQFVDTGVVCRVTLRENEIESVAEYPADSISIGVLGTVTHVDATTKIVDVQSQGTFVAAAD